MTARRSSPAARADREMLTSANNTLGHSMTEQIPGHARCYRCGGGTGASGRRGQRCGSRVVRTAHHRSLQGQQPASARRHAQMQGQHLLLQRPRPRHLLPPPRREVLVPVDLAVRPDRPGAVGRTGLWTTTCVILQRAAHSVALSGAPARCVERVTDGIPGGRRWWQGPPPLSRWAAPEIWGGPQNELVQSGERGPRALAHACRSGDSGKQGRAERWLAPPPV